VWILDHLAAGGGPSAWIRWAVLGIAVTVVLAVATVLALAVRGRGRREARAADQARVSGATARDRFAEADRLAAAGDLTGAVRALAGGVASSLGDDRDWEVSPLTVREIFWRSSNPEALAPLLAAFEAAVYGAREPDAETYARAARAAAGYRPTSSEKAA
jgi:hypothetical protein